MTNIMINGKVEHVQEKEYQGNKTTILQFIAKSERKGFEIVKVKLTDEILTVKVGETIQVPVSISTMNNQLFFSQNGKIQKVS